MMKDRHPDRNYFVTQVMLTPKGSQSTIGLMLTFTTFA
jgi:hypothetical protein